MTGPFVEYTCKNALGVIGAYHLLGEEISVHCPPVQIRSCAGSDISRRIIDRNNLLLARKGYRKYFNWTNMTPQLSDVLQAIQIPYNCATVIRSADDNTERFGKCQGRDSRRVTTKTFFELNLKCLTNTDVPYTNSRIFGSRDQSRLIREDSKSNRQRMQILCESDKSVSLNTENTNTSV